MSLHVFLDAAASGSADDSDDSALSFDSLSDPEADPGYAPSSSSSEEEEEEEAELSSSCPSSDSLDDHEASMSSSSASFSGEEEEEESDASLEADSEESEADATVRALLDAAKERRAAAHAAAAEGRQRHRALDPRIARISMPVMKRIVDAFIHPIDPDTREPILPLSQAECEEPDPAVPIIFAHEPGVHFGQAALDVLREATAQFLVDDLFHGMQRVANARARSDHPERFKEGKELDSDDDSDDPCAIMHAEVGVLDFYATLIIKRIDTDVHENDGALHSIRDRRIIRTFHSLHAMPQAPFVSAPTSVQPPSAAGTVVLVPEPPHLPYDAMAVLVDDIMAHTFYLYPCQVSDLAVEALRDAAEDHIVQLLADAYLIAYNTARGHKTIADAVGAVGGLLGMAVFSARGGDGDLVRPVEPGVFVPGTDAIATPYRWPEDMPRVELQPEHLHLVRFLIGPRRSNMGIHV